MIFSVIECFQNNDYLYVLVPSPAHKTPSHYMEGILFGINQTSEATNDSRLDENDESPPPPLPLRQPRVVRPPVSHFYVFFLFSFFSNLIHNFNKTG